MTNVGAQCRFLKASQELKDFLLMAGRKERFAVQQRLFREDDGNDGVFLLIRGKVGMSIENLPKLNRLFSGGSLLGLPSTFTGRPYSLTATAVTEADVVHVAQEDFVKLMRERPELCREATEMLGREVTFIQKALAERRKQASSRKLATTDGVVAVG